MTVAAQTAGTCDQVMNEAIGGVAAALRAVDCVANEATGVAFGRLFAPGGVLVPVLTVLLTLYVAFFAFQLITGRSSIGVKALTPRFLTIGLVMTFATSWVAYQSVVLNLFVLGPDWLASALMGTQESATEAFADKIDIVFAAVEAVSNPGQIPGVPGQEAAPPAQDIDTFSPKGLLWMGAVALLLGTVGLLVTARIGLAILVGLGPVFVVLGLFQGTRGLFTGWLKGVVLLGITPLFAVLGGSLMLEMTVPILNGLASTPGDIPARPAMAFFMIGMVHVALMIMVVKVASTMVAGWSVFGLVPEKGESSGRSMASSPPPATVVNTTAPSGNAGVMSTAQAAAAGSYAPSRRIEMSGITPSPAANDAAGTSSAAGGMRTTNVYATSSGNTRPQPLTGTQSRTHGIGNRFRSPEKRTTEKLK
ncbi:type IV secretion system protein [Qipengyuania sp. JC766]|uniref:type IV secretion system protein n=1 Tax=Qipengyuania sp. JC766 TaxID=3232139 RepID=UPI00345AAB84